MMMMICLLCVVATKSVNRPTRNGTFIHFKDATTNTIVRSYDCGWAPEVQYTGFTVVIRFPSPPWVIGHSYYVMFDSGRSLMPVTMMMMI